MASLIPRLFLEKPTGQTAGLISNKKRFQQSKKLFRISKKAFSSLNALFSCVLWAISDHLHKFLTPAA